MWRNSLTIMALSVALAACGDNGATASTAADNAEAQTSAAASITPAPAIQDADAGAYAVDPDHGYIAFSYTHLGLSNPILRWGSWTGDLDWNSENPEASSITVVIDATSVDSGVERFDGHLQGADFFDTETYPEIRFVSTDIQLTGAESGTVTGDLTIKGKTLPVALDVVFNGAAAGDKDKIGFSAKGALKRSDFGMDIYAGAASDNVDVIVEAEFVQIVAE